MDLKDCDENCKICLTYFNPDGEKILKCKHSDTSEVIMISLLVAFSSLCFLICFLLFLIRQKRKKPKIKKIETEERIIAENTPIKSTKNLPYIKRKISRLNLNDGNSNMKKRKTSATTVTVKKQNLNSSETLNNIIHIKKKKFPP
jgi:hypothetical protein